ncbi:MAG: hypothetical protein N3G21_06920 [Candidatus Hydrogenedentes bacterium]|nr:hypothetical protein [Candidatus Hydrogenedentota bacterium]
MTQWLTAITAINMLSRVISSLSFRKAGSSQKILGESFHSRLKKEIESKYTVEQNARKILELYDSDRDGKISLRESGMEAQEFARWDMNGDSFVTVDEIKVLYSNLGPFVGKEDKV